MIQYERWMSNVCLFCIIGSYIQLLLMVVQFSTFSTQSVALTKWNYLTSSIVNRPAHLIFDSNQMPILLEKNERIKRNHNRWLLIISENIWQRSIQQIFEITFQFPFKFVSWSNRAIYRCICTESFTTYNCNIICGVRRLNTDADRCCWLLLFNNVQKRNVSIRHRNNN